MIVQALVRLASTAWAAPIRAELELPPLRPIFEIDGLPRPTNGGSQRAWITPMIMAVTPRIEPTERSMWRITMTSTMPDVITAIEDVWTSRFHKLRGVMNTPPPFSIAP